MENRITPGQVIRLGDDDLKALGNRVSNMITDLENVYAPYFKDLAVWWNWYEAVPRSDKKNFPFAGASNIIVPVSKTMSDALVARTYSKIFGAGNKIWTVSTENEGKEEVARNMVRYLNWQARNDFSMRAFVYDWLTELFPIGSSVGCIAWREDVRTMFMNQKGRKGGKIKTEEVMFRRGPVIEHTPREFMLWDTAHRIADAPCVVRQFQYSYSQILNMAANSDGWIKENVEMIRGEDGRSFAPSQRVQDAKRKRDGQVLGHHAMNTSHDIRECHIDWPLFASMGHNGTLAAPGEEEFGTPSIPIVVTIDRRTETVLRLVAEPYFLPYKPFFDGFFRKRSGRGHAVGVCKQLEHLQEGITTQVNQSIDSTTRSNAIWGKTTNPALVSKPFDPRHPMKLNNMDEFEPMALPQSTGPNMQNITMLQAYAERVGGIFDPAVGRETRSGGHPSPATTTLALLEQTDVMASGTNELIRQEISRMGEAIAILDQQYELDDEGKINRVLGDKDAGVVKSFLFPEDPIPSNWQFDVHAMSETLNPDTEMQKAVTMSQMNTQYWSVVLQQLQNVLNPQMPPELKAGALRFIEAQSKTQLRFLEAIDEDGADEFVLNLKRAQSGERDDIRNLAGSARELAASSGVPLTQGGAGVAASPGSGEIRSDGPFGPVR